MEIETVTLDDVIQPIVTETMDAPKEEEKPQEKPAEPPAKAEPKEDVRSAVMDALAEIGRNIPQTQANKGLSPTQQIEAHLRAQNVPEEAIKNMFALTLAVNQEAAAAQAAQSQVKAAESYQQQCVQVALEALDSVSKPVKPLANAGLGLRMDLVQRISDEIGTNSAFSDLKRAIDSGLPPNKNRMKEVAAKIADKWCEENDVVKPARPIDMKSSKPEVPSAKDFNLNALSRGGQQIYAITLRTTKDEAKARSRALAHG